MSTETAPPPETDAPRKRRAFSPWVADTPQGRSVQIGVMGTLLVHLIFLLFAPRLFLSERSHREVPHRQMSRHFNVDLVPNPAHRPPPPPKPRMRYVEANPNAPENTPDKTNNVSDRNQQAAQEKPDLKHHNDTPTQEGRKDIPVQQIVTGNLSKPQPSEPQVPQVTPQPPAPNVVQRRERNPIVGFDKAEGSNPEGYASNIGRKPENQQNVPNPVTGSKEGPDIASFAAGIPQIDRKHPQQRRVLEQHVRPAVFAENKFGTSNVGVTGFDARWSNYGVYMKRLCEIVQIEWEHILDDTRPAVVSGNMVTVTFVLNSRGQVARIIKVDPAPGTSEGAKNACAAAISNPSPYGVWSDDMIAVLGSEQTISFTFFYE
jgi:hypothetical protein